ncbi:hypothetical protein SAMN04488105_10381 [Salipiger thiooxidans]|uniref:Uncharacterized protein n=1 Tax=Salipiger thiooxidans TaxID=282683 RepID=A0A1G7CDE8_9RHOB|nr:DUF6882 domain-containing protein [Salipiger thiooxidans]SDE37358.1 hypothetical protein SAMN04488105_10381 [Salipiger thiooxidans]
MRRSDKIRIGRDPEGGGREEPGSYRGEGIWSWCRESNIARELPRTEEFVDTLKWVGAGYHASLPRLYRDFGLSENGGAWEVFPDHGLFKVTTGSGRSWFAEYGLVASWNHETHSWLWAWAFPRDWQVPPPLITAAGRTCAVGHEMGWAPLVEPSLLVNEREAWALTALAAHVSELPLIYRARVNEVNTHYFAMSTPVWAS